VTAANRLQVCYVLVCQGWDRHAQMTWLSAQSLRRHESDVKITLVTEPETHRALQSVGKLLGVVDDVVTIETPIEDRRLRAFHLKTLMRGYVDGDFLFIDGDTLVVNRVGDAFDFDAEVAAAVDFNFDHTFFPRQLRGPYTKLGWTYPLPFYFNSGVVLMRDTRAVRQLSEEWTRRWSLLVEEGVPGDQDAFASALFARSIKWTRLPKAFNSIVIKRNYRFREAKILHFFGSEDEQRGTILEHLLVRLRETGTFDEAAYQRCLREGHPWGPNHQPWHLWHSRNYVRAVLLKARNTAARIVG
jgi:hypothetical protein